VSLMVTGPEDTLWASLTNPGKTTGAGSAFGCRIRFFFAPSLRTTKVMVRIKASLRKEVEVLLNV
jgi:hypothetical protein